MNVTTTLKPQPKFDSVTITLSPEEATILTSVLCHDAGWPRWAQRVTQSLQGQLWRTVVTADAPLKEEYHALSEKWTQHE